MPKVGRIAAMSLVVALVAACGSEGEEAALSTRPPGAIPPVSEPGGTPPPTPAPGSVQAACDAFTVEELGQILANPVRPANGQGKNCFWGTSVDRGTSVFLSITKPASPQECTVQRNALPKEATQEPVSGVGTSSVWSWQQVSILVQGTFLSCWPDAVIAVMMTGEKDQALLKTAASTLAQRVHSRL